MEIQTKTFQTPNGLVEGVQVSWSGFGVLLVAGSKGFLACPAFDVDACQRFGTLERFPDRKVTKANSKAEALGIKKGMDVGEAFAFIA